MDAGYAVAAVLSGAFFGLTGLFTRTLTGAGLSTMGILSIRCSVAALCFFCTALGDIRQLKMHKKDFWLFAAVGILGQGMFSFCYYNAINMMSISTACILMYLSPVFVTIMAHFVFMDGISRRTVLAIILCIAGCACVSGFGGTMTLLGLICGLGSAIAFALINILTRALLGRGYTGKAVNFWICAFAALFGISSGSAASSVKGFPARLRCSFRLEDLPWASPWRSRRAFWPTGSSRWRCTAARAARCPFWRAASPWWKRS